MAKDPIDFASEEGNYESLDNFFDSPYYNFYGTEGDSNMSVGDDDDFDDENSEEEDDWDDSDDFWDEEDEQDEAYYEDDDE